MTVIKKPLDAGVKRVVRMLIKEPLSEFSQPTDVEFAVGLLLCELGYLPSWGKRSDLPRDLRELKVWEDE